MANDKLDLAHSGKAVAFVYVTDRDRALAFYRDTLGLPLRDSDPYGDFLDLPGSLLRLTTITDFEPHPHPVLGFDVEDIEAVAAALRDRGVPFDIFEGMGQDANGICAMPDGGKLAFFKDSEGNALMLSQG
jgi:catechol 2,3-dioxygenase-like lactoylglutathione lyase family enzyme